MSDESLTQELREHIVWIDGHADVWAVFAHPDLLRRCVDALVAPFRQAGVTDVVGIESRGFVLGGAAAVAIGAGFVAVRRATGHLPGELLNHQEGSDYRGEPVRLRLQRHRLGSSSRVLVVDDWFETGSQLAVAATLIQATGAHVVGASVIVDQTPIAVRSTVARYHWIVRGDDLGAG